MNTTDLKLIPLLGKLTKRALNAPLAGALIIGGFALVADRTHKKTPLYTVEFVH
jgi:hypothetical protein